MSITRSSLSFQNCLNWLLKDNLIHERQCTTVIIPHFNASPQPARSLSWLTLSARNKFQLFLTELIALLVSFFLKNGSVLWNRYQFLTAWWAARPLLGKFTWKSKMISEESLSRSVGEHPWLNFDSTLSSSSFFSSCLGLFLSKFCKDAHHREIVKSPDSSR